jgi:hypothetical protein
MPSLSWTGLAAHYIHEGVGLLGMLMSCDDAFVGSHAQRNMLVDRAHHYFNGEWKLEVLALTGNTSDTRDTATRDSVRLLYYHLTEDHLYDVVDKVDQLHSMHNSLKPETIDLVGRCRTTTDVKHVMVAPTDPASFLGTMATCP